MKKENKIRLPKRIDETTMTVKSPAKNWRYVVDFIFTLLAWCAFIYLIVRGVRYIQDGSLNAVGVPVWSKFFDAIGILGIYLLAMILQGAFLILWALYNKIRFQGKHRRTNVEKLSDELLAGDYDIDQEGLQRLRSNSISIIHHDDIGRITLIEHPEISVSRAP